MHWGRCAARADLARCGRLREIKARSGATESTLIGNSDEGSIREGTEERL
jgi:hypothetical protein